MRVLAGDCVQLGSGELPYAPLVTALRPLARTEDPALAALAQGTRAELAGFLPSLGDGTRQAGIPGDDAAQGRVFEALLAVFDTLASERPLLLVIEDLHWADRSTRAFLAFLARSLGDERLLLVATYRPDELHRRHPLRPLLAELERATRARRIELAPLSQEELAEQLADILGADVDEDLVERLWTRSEGNPLYSEELLAAGLDGRGTLPPTLRDALMLRIEKLPDIAQELLRVLAVGQRLDHTVLADAAEVDGRVLREALREAVASHILTTDSEGRYAFRHALLREVVEEDLLPGERSELHLALARALERRVEEVGERVHLTSAIAHHYAAGGDQPAALQAAVRAAGAAERVHAYGEEADLLERALSLWAHVPDAERLAGKPKVRVLRRAAFAHEAQSNHARAEALLEKAMELIDERRTPGLAANTLERLARVQWQRLRPSDALETARRGLEIAEGERSSERAQLLGWWAKARMLQGRYREAVEVARETIVLAQEIGDQIAESRARNALGYSLVGSGEVEAGAAELRKSIAIANSIERHREQMSGYANLSDALLTAGRTREALDVAYEGLALTEPRSGDRMWMTTAVYECAFMLGDWELADSSLPAPSQPRSDTLRLFVLLGHAKLALARGDDDRARAMLTQALPLTENSSEPQFHGPTGALRAELQLRDGDIEGARNAIDHALDRIEFCAEDAARMAHLAAVGTIVEAEAGQRARDLGQPFEMDRAELMLARVAAAHAGPVEAAWLSTAKAEVSRARGDADVEGWLAAEAAWNELEYRLLRLRAAAGARPRRSCRTGDRAGATESVTAALATARKLGAGRLIAALEGLAARARLGVEPEGEPASPDAPPPPRPPPPRPADPFGLTPRERQVLELVAGGATNREVGEQLYMSEKTASVHVSRILAKLDVRSRTEAAGVAHRFGLVASRERSVA